MRPVEELGSRFACAAVPAGLALVLALSAVGLVAEPVRDVERARDSRTETAERTLRAERARALLAELREADAPARTAAAGAALRRLFPDRVTPVELYGAACLAALAEEVALTAVDVGEVGDPGLSVLDDWVAVREVSLRGSAPLERLPRLVEGLRSLGHPCAVLDVRTSRDGPDASSFDFSLTLGVFESRPVADWQARFAPDESEGGW